MELLGGYAYFRAEAELAAVRKAGRCIDIDRRRIDFVQKLLRIEIVLGDNALAVTCAVFRDMRYRLIDIIYRFYADLVIEIFFSPVLFCRRLCKIEDGADYLIAENLDILSL